MCVPLFAGPGRLLSCVKVTTLTQGETVTHMQWSQTAAALAVATSKGRVLRFTADTSGGSSNVSGQQQQQQWWAAGTGATWRAEGSLTVPDNAKTTSLQLDPCRLSEGVVATAAATAWYVDILAQQQVPLLAALAGQITGLVNAAATAAGSGVCGRVASLCDDGWLAIWETQRGSQVQFISMAQHLEPWTDLM